MPYEVTLDEQDLVQLAFLAGFAAGTGNGEASGVVSSIMDRLRPVGYDANVPEQDRVYDPNELPEEAWQVSDDFPTLNDPLPNAAATPLPGEPISSPSASPFVSGSQIGAGPPPGGISGVNP